MSNLTAHAFLYFLLMALALLAVEGCGGSEKKGPVRLNVACAASFTEVMDETAKAYFEQTGTVVECEYGSSGALARKVTEGAPVDLFVSANLTWVQFLRDKGKAAPDGGVILARNSLVCVVPAESDAVPGSAAEFAGLERVALGDPEHVPAGIYACQALKNLGVWDSLSGSDRLVLSQDVRAVLSLVEQGVAGAGLVYATDAMASERVRVAFTFPESSHDPVDYHAAVISSSPNAAAAVALLEFMRGERFREILTRRGFTIP